MLENKDRRLVVGRIVIVLLAVERGWVGHLEGLKELVDRAPEGALVLDRAIEPVEVGAGPLLDPGTPKIDDRLRGSRRRPARQAFTHQHGHCIFDRRIRPIRNIGKVSAVVGTHTHVQTADERILPQGTAYITDLGMTGSYAGVIGMEKDEPLKRSTTKIAGGRLEPGGGKAALSGLAVEIDDRTGLALRAMPLRLGPVLPPAEPDFGTTP